MTIGYRGEDFKRFSALSSCDRCGESLFLGGRPAKFCCRCGSLVKRQPFIVNERDSDILKSDAEIAKEIAFMLEVRLCN